VENVTKLNVYTELIWL